MKKRFLAMALTGIMTAGLLAGCGSSGDTQADTAKDAKDEKTADTGKDSDGGGKTEVVLWHSMVSPEVEPFQEMIDNFNAQSEKATVVTEWVARDEQTKQLTIGNMAGELPDMVFVDNPEVINYGEMGVFQDIKKQFDGWDENSSWTVSQTPVYMKAKCTVFLISVIILPCFMIRICWLPQAWKRRLPGMNWWMQPKRLQKMVSTAWDFQRSKMRSVHSSLCRSSGQQRGTGRIWDRMTA